MVHYRDAAEIGGSLRVGETVATHVDPKRVAVEMVFAYGGPGPIARQIQVPCHFIGARGPRDFAAWLHARALFTKIQPDLIHFQEGVVWLRAALLGTAYKKVVHVHGRYERSEKSSGSGPTPFRASPLLRAYLRSTDAQICINNGARRALLKLGWISPENSYVVYNSIDVSRFSPSQDRALARSALNLPPEALLLGMVCRLVWEKGCADLLSIIERLPARWHGVICGDGPLREQLEQECQRRGIADRLHFLGLQDDVRPVYAALDAYAFLSRYEPFGLVLAEAMAAGVPVFGIEGDGEYNETEYPLITADTVALVSFDNSGVYRGAMPETVLDQVARRVEHYGADPASYRWMSEQAKTAISERFAAPLQAEVMTGVYETICGVGNMSPQNVMDWYQSKRTPVSVDGGFDLTGRERATA